MMLHREPQAHPLGTAVRIDGRTEEPRTNRYPVIPAKITFVERKPSWVPSNVHAGVHHDKANHRFCKLVKHVGYCVFEFPEVMQ